jgi:RNA 2',3'-cyclic 3'-phosphodiesterase
LFLALDPPAATQAAIAAWRDSALAGRDELRPVAPEALHLTLVFLGYRPEKEIAAIAGAAFGAAAGLHGALLTPLGVKAVPPRRPRLFALDLDDPDAVATAIQVAAADALAHGGYYEPEKRPFWPHITLARVKKRRRAEPFEAEPGSSVAEPFLARALTLYRSTLRPQGALYEPLERLTLPER